MSRYGNGCFKSRQTLLTEAYGDNFRGEATTTNKKVSVVIPVYNGEKYLKKAIESVVRQTLPADEIIVIDDGSTDDSALVIAELAKVYPLKFFQKENGGQSSARNYGVSVSCGELIAFLDQDDIWYPNHIEELVRPFLKNFYPEIGWVYSTVDEIGENDQLYCIDSLSYCASVHPKKTIYECLATDMLVIPSATIVSRKAFNDVGGFDEQLSGYEDDDLFVRIFSKGYGNVFINKSTTQWRTHRTRCSRSSKMAISRIIYARKLLREYQDDDARGKKYYNIILSRFITTITDEYSIAIISGDKNYANLIHETLHKLYPYMKFPLRLECNLQLFFFRHQLLRSILSPFSRIYWLTQRLIKKKS
jgi:glycosyltransferase involved in cell wall biosynthesis